MPRVDGRRERFERGDVEFGRALGFFDAAFAVALTLLVTTLDGASDPTSWQSLSAFNTALGSQLVPFAISFVVIGGFWYGHHRFVSKLQAIDGSMIAGSLCLVAAIVLIPFTTEAIGSPNMADLPLPVALYSCNIVAASLAGSALDVLATRRGLLRTAPSQAVYRARLFAGILPSIVFLGSIPLAYLLSPYLAKLSWLILVPLGAISGRRVDRAEREAGTSGDAAPASSLDSGEGR